MQGKWLKFAVDFCDDEKIKIIRGHEGGDSFVWLWLWLLTTAMKKETDTLYIVAGRPYDAAVIAQQADVKIDTVTRGIELFRHLHMIEWLDDGGLVLINFQRHQSLGKMQEKRELAKIRQQKHRAAISYESETVTRDKCDSHATEKKRIEKNRKENITDTTPSQKGATKKLTPSQQIAKDTLWAAWQDEYHRVYSIPYKPTAGDWPQVYARNLLDLPQDRIRALVSAWFAAPEKERRYYPHHLRSFAAGFERAETLIRKTDDCFTTVRGWGEGK